MPYIGKTPLTGAYQLCDTITTSATATYNLTVGSSPVIPGAAQNCIVSLNGVIQAPVSAYTVSGSTIVFASTLSATDVIDFILILGNVFDIGKPTDGSVTNASVASNAAIALSKLATTGTMTFASTIGVGGATPAASGAGITFPATQSASTDANTLDDYEEGTWTPVYALQSGSVTYSSQTGNYVKIGRQVTVSFLINVAVSTSGVFENNIDGLPFTGSNTNYSGASFSAYGTPNNGTPFSTRCNIIGLAAANASIQLRFTSTADRSPDLIAGTSIANGTLLAGSMTYFTT
jgi:hypothetical protein